MELGKELVAIAQDPDKVTTAIVNHHDATRETIPVDYLIGADGARGTIIPLR